MPQMRRVSKNNTTVLCHRGNILVTLYQTPVVDVRDDIVTLDNGGYITATTQARMNQASKEFGLGYYVQRRKGKMFVHVETPFPPELGAEFIRRTIPFRGESVCFNRRTGKEVLSCTI